MSFTDLWQMNLKRNLPMGHRLETLNAKDKALAESIDQSLQKIIAQMKDAARSEVD